MIYAKDAKRSMFHNLDYYNHCLSYNILGATYPWTSLKGCLFQEEKLLYQQCWMGSLNMGISLPCHTTFLLTLWQIYLITLIHYMEFLKVWQHIEIVFTSGFWQGLFKLLGIELHLSSIYHPQTNGQIERLNHCLEMYLRCMTFHQPR